MFILETVRNIESTVTWIAATIDILYDIRVNYIQKKKK